MAWKCMVLMCFMVAVCAGRGGEVDVNWGIADSTATSGRLFYLHIPSDAFTGPGLSYSVQSADGQPLPSWLEFDAANNVLQGIPTPKDSGQLFLEITAKGATNQASVTFTIYVRDVSSHTSGAPLKFKTSGPEFVRCKQKEPETIATIVVDTDLEALPVAKRVDLLRKFLSHMKLDQSMVKMVPVGNSPMHDSSALVSGTGDSPIAKTSGLFISWPVGCGQVKEGHFPVLQRLDDDSGNGRMAQVLGHPIIGWYVTNSHIQAPSRKRRQVRATPTMAVTPVVPTKTDTTDGADDKMTHKIIETQSPTFIQPTATQSTMAKTDEPVTLPTGPKDSMQSEKVMPTEKVPDVTPVTKTVELPPIEPTKTYTSESTQQPVVTVECGPKNPFPDQTYYAGEIINVTIPDDVFDDCGEIGETKESKLYLFLDVSTIIQPNYFLQLDSHNRRIYGLPSVKDKGTHKMNLLVKKQSLMARKKFDIKIVGVKNKNKLTYESSITVKYNYTEFTASVTNKIELANKIASIYGDADMKHLVITNIKSGSVIYSWTNSSLISRDKCPSSEINELVRKLINEDGTLTQDAIEKLKPFVLLSAAAKPNGVCEQDGSFTAVTSKPLSSENVTEDKGPKDITTLMPGVDSKDKPSEDTTVDDVAKGSKTGDNEDDIWITTVVPAVVIVVILLIALLVACILYRKKRKGKMNVEEQNTFINKGAPVIFPDELEDKPSDVNKPLLVEGSPAPPPEYHRGTSESPEPHLGNKHRTNANNSALDEDGFTEMPERSYEPYDPPPPVTASSNNKQPRPTHQQQPFSQPPQILP